MKRKKVERWVLVCGYEQLATGMDADFGHVADDERVVHLTEPDPLAPLYKRVALAAVGWVTTHSIVMEKVFEVRMVRAVSALQKAKKAGGR